jgi:hypothetical protein
MKRVSIFLITVALIAGMAGCAYTTPPPSQNLEIRTWYDLDAVRDNLGGNHTLMNDLDSTTPGYEELASPTANQGKGWQPIGTFIPHTDYGWMGFYGTFDGQGYEIRDLFINRPDEDWVGLFGLVNPGGCIEDIGVVNVTVIGAEDVGGLVGCNWGLVRNSYSSGNITGGSRAGGLVGLNEYSTVSNCYSTGNVTGNYWYVGGLVGLNEYSTVSNSYSNGNVSGNSSFVGGLVGFNGANGYGTVSNSYSTGSVSGSNKTGGLVGWNSGSVSNSFWDTETSGQTTSAGGTGKTIAEMQDIATFSGAGWIIIAVANPGTRNSSYIWNIVDDETYPFLSWQPIP